MIEKNIIISGIQQMGIGVVNADEAFDWYKKHFGMDIPVFKSADVAELMLPYTGNAAQERYAILAINMGGGGGFEIWQYTQRTPLPAKFEIKLGDLGIFAAKIKCNDVKAMYLYALEQKLNVLGTIGIDPSGRDHFYIRDPYNNIFEVVQADTWFKAPLHYTGGVYGAVIGVSNMNASIEFYSKVLGYDKVVYDVHGNFDDYSSLGASKNTYRRVLLRHSKARMGAFSMLLGPSEIELVQAEGMSVQKIYKDRFWGDLGFIHLCFDIRGMKELEIRCASLGHPFTVNSSSSFDMGEAAGHFSYIEDPDGALIEFVETHRVPILKKLGIYLNLKKRNPVKALPKILISAFALAREK